MSTVATFAGTALAGLVVNTTPGSVAARAQEHELFGLTGASQIVGGAAPADFEILLWLNGFASSVAIKAYITTLEAIALAGTTGSLVISGDLSETYLNTTLRQVQQVSSNGQSGSLPNDPDDSNNPWTSFVKLKFRRLA